MSGISYLIGQNEVPDIVDESVAGQTFLGFFRPGEINLNDMAAKNCCIKKISVAANISITQYSEGSKDKTQSWANRANLNYTFLK